MHATRQDSDDLEIVGELAGVPPGASRYVAYDDLLALPLVTAMVDDDPNFGRAVTITGVPLAELPALLGAKPDAKMVTAICDDAYAAHYPAAYLAAHHPLLVLKVNGERPAHWPIGTDGSPMGPYMIAYVHYRPSFRVFAHVDEPQVPWGVVKLALEDEAKVYAPIEPKGPHASDELVQQGYTIARQSCFRCHSRDGEGGTKSARSWDFIARYAVERPASFDEYVVAPKRVNPDSQMAASPQYDAATLHALHAYFSQFVESGR